MTASSLWYLGSFMQHQGFETHASCNAAVICSFIFSSWEVYDWWHSGKKFTHQHRRSGRPGFDPWMGKVPWRRKWQATPVFLPGKSRGWRSLVDYSPQGCKGSDTTEWVNNMRINPLPVMPSWSDIESRMYVLLLREWSRSIPSAAAPFPQSEDFVGPKDSLIPHVCFPLF